MGADYTDHDWRILLEMLEGLGLIVLVHDREAGEITVRVP